MSSKSKSPGLFTRLRIAIACLVIVAIGFSIHASLHALKRPSFDRHRDILHRTKSLSPITSITFPENNPHRFKLRATPVFTHQSFKAPVFMTSPPGHPNDFYVVERGGCVKKFHASEDSAEAVTFVDISDKVDSTGGSGLLSMAFHPEYEKNRIFYLFYTTHVPRKLIISSFKGPDDENGHVDLASEHKLIELDKTHHSHNGGMMAFGPDGMFYISVGDAMINTNVHKKAQDLSSLLGKMLRIDVSSGEGYTIPPDNPFVGQEGVRGEIWAYGFRQPWRFSFDQKNGDLWLGEVGQDMFEEINLVTKGSNYGWVDYEANKAKNKSTTLAFDQTVAPVQILPHNAARAVIGGYVYHGDKIPWLEGAYLFGDADSGSIWSLRKNDRGEYQREELSFAFAISSFAEDQSGNLYAVSLKGPIYRFENNLDGDPPDVFPKLLSETGIFKNLKTLEPAKELIAYDVVSPLWSDGTTKKRWLGIPAGQKINVMESGKLDFPKGAVFVKHFEISTTKKGAAKRLETRVMVHELNGWAGYTYRWNEQQDDARLLKSEEHEKISTFDAYGEKVTFDYMYPSPNQCMRCHNSDAGSVLGFRPEQLNFQVAYEDGKANQLQALEDLGLFCGATENMTIIPPLVDPADEKQPLAQRARSYLDANCSACHRGEGVSGNMDLRAYLTLEETQAAVHPTGEKNKIKKTKYSWIIAPGKSQESLMWGRMGSRSAKYQMPQIGSSRVDQAGLDVIGRWIDSLAQGVSPKP